ncbi:hypothetical protein D9756_010775 [Leucocoprinus leucothites]|uniref:Uncharacterized protein n=1 Tax=Leucocoprinus leucothites TaxID=201217 RepID=A0A8H5CW17_9AGAR|nr:hypothetical protein D9756_010775 [Leucoagaricus leucothites]
MGKGDRANSALSPFGKFRSPSPLTLVSRTAMCTSTLMELFSCCFPRKRSRPNQPDEQTYLIPTEPQPESLDDEITRRQRALQGRLTEIVRAKEGKMVNLHVRLPFNLHNRTTSSLSGRLDPSSSRSASDSLLASPVPTSPRYPITYAVNHHQYHYTSPLGYVDEHHSSASRSSSRLTPQPDQQGHDHDGEGEDEPTDGLNPEDDRFPILNLRLVNPNPAFGIGTINRPLLMRGRSPLKLTTTLEPTSETASSSKIVGEQSGALPQPPPPPPQSPKSDVTEYMTLGKEESAEGEDVMSPSSTVGPSAAGVPKTPTDAEQLIVSISPASTNSFKIHETSPLVIDWGS